MSPNSRAQRSRKRIGAGRDPRGVAVGVGPRRPAPPPPSPPPAPPPPQPARSVRLLLERPEVARIVARCCLDGPRDLLKLAAPPPDLLERCVRPLERALKRAGLGDED